MTEDSLVFGWRTAILSVAVAIVLSIAAGLSRTLVNRSANRTLAGMLLVLSGIVTPSLIGFAGFYDRWRWLTFLPVSNPLAVGPLIYLYVRALVDGAWPRRGSRHLWLAAAHFAFNAASFLLPMDAKSEWADIVDAWVATPIAVIVVASLIGYGVASLRLVERYRGALAAVRSDDARFAVGWLSRAVTALFVLLPVWVGYTLWDAVSPLGYFRLMGLQVAIAAFAVYVAIEGWRHAALPFPPLAQMAQEAQPAPADKRDWRATGADWAARTEAAGWHRDPELSLKSLARHLGTNSGHLSRALNDGLGVNFSTFVNGLRADEVAARLRGTPSDGLLDIALAAGFASKASFYRAFAARYGCSPHAYRRREISKAEE